MYHKNYFNMLRLYKNSFLVDVNAKYVLMETKMRGLDVILRIRRLQRSFRGVLGGPASPSLGTGLDIYFYILIHCWRGNIKFFKYLKIKYSSAHFPYYILPTQNIHILQEVRFHHKMVLAIILG